MEDNKNHDLGTIEKRILDSLEDNLAHTLGQVKAFRRIAEEVTSTEREIRRHKAVAAQIDAELKSSRSDTLQTELDGEKNRIHRLEQIHSALVGDLSELANALHNA